VSGAGQRRQEESLTAEQRRFDAAGELYVVAHGVIEGHNASGIDLKHLACGKIEFHEIAAGMNEHRARTGKLLQDEALAAEETRTQLLHHGYVELHGRLREEEGVALRHQGSSGRQIEYLYTSGIIAGEADFAGTVRAKVSQKQRFADHDTAQDPHEFLTQGNTAHARIPMDVQ